jgi:uncharacterized membrane protein
LLLLIALLGSVLGVSLAMYLYWSPVQFHRIEGLQPRYYLPLIPFVLLLFSRERLGATLENYLPARLRERLLFVTATMYVAAVLYTPWVAAHRFYNLGLTAAVKLVLR